MGETFLSCACPGVSPALGIQATVEKITQEAVGSEIWACDFLCVRTITFRTLYVFFVIDHARRQVLHVHVTPNPSASVRRTRQPRPEHQGRVPGH